MSKRKVLSESEQLNQFIAARGVDGVVCGDAGRFPDVVPTYGRPRARDGLRGAGEGQEGSHPST